MKLYALIAIPMLACAGIAHADTLQNKPSLDPANELQVVKIADLDLGKSSDAETLKSRVYSAAVKVCKMGNDGKIYFKSNLDCIRDAVATANEKIEMAIEHRRNRVVATRRQWSVQKPSLAQQVSEIRQ
jgi:UrcA family protein